LTGPAFFPHLPDDHSPVRSLALVSSPASEEHPLHLLFFKSVMSARERIWITTPYFVPTRSLIEVLAERAQAGVDVRILLPNHHTDAKAVRRAGQAAYQKLLDAGVRIFEYQPTMIHTKSLMVDGKWSVIGSANMDIRSTELNEENVLGILDEPFARELATTFEADLQHALEIDPSGWRRRGIGARVLEHVSGFFGEQY
jgi:cardiolipin synthase